MKISYVVPLFNEEESIEILYKEVVENSPVDFEIIFINDGSTDKSQNVLEKLASSDGKIKIIQFRKNFGKAAGLFEGFKVAKGDIIFTLDADLQDNPIEIPNFISKINEGYDLVTGWKKDRKDPLSKRIPSKFANFVMSKMFSLKIHDFNCGFKAYRKEVVKELDIYGEMHRYIPALCQSRGFKVAEIPVNHRKREFGKSKYGIERFLRSSFDLIKVKLITDYLQSPLYFFGRIGTISVFLGTIISLYLTIEKIFFDQFLSNRPLLFFGILLITIGIQFFSIGLLGELMVNQSRSITRNKSISIRKKINLDSDEN